MGNGDGEKIVARFRDCRLVKGYMRGFSNESGAVVLKSRKRCRRSPSRSKS